MCRQGREKWQQGQSLAGLVVWQKVEMADLGLPLFILALVALVMLLRNLFVNKKSGRKVEGALKFAFYYGFIKSTMIL